MSVSLLALSYMLLFSCFAVSTAVVGAHRFARSYRMGSAALRMLRLI
jgi:hypothetical protein